MRAGKRYNASRKLESDLASYSEHIQQQVRYRLIYLKKVEELNGENVTCQNLPRAIKLAAEENADPHPPSALSVSDGGNDG
ncbi:hypothetical protein [Methyloglobulus sp.]|uniref:hypothetical protein n=1 Tax=Methyloglobulus sp. TaxID=2518622 RepID=UPI0032B7CB3E